jgi:hypothetical protein
MMPGHRCLAGRSGEQLYVSLPSSTRSLGSLLRCINTTMDSRGCGLQCHCMRGLRLHELLHEQRAGASTSHIERQWSTQVPCSMKPTPAPTCAIARTCFHLDLACQLCLVWDASRLHHTYENGHDIGRAIYRGTNVYCHADANECSGIHSPCHSCHYSHL